MNDTLVILCCFVDEFCKEFYPEWERALVAQGTIKRRRPSNISPAEIMTIIIFHVLRFRDFKTYYVYYVVPHLKPYFPFLPSYRHMVNLMKPVLVPLCIFVQGLTREIMALKLTAENVGSRKPKPVPDLVKHLTGKLFGDKGHISQELFEKLF